MSEPAPKEWTPLPGRAARPERVGHEAGRDVGAASPRPSPRPAIEQAPGTAPALPRPSITLRPSVAPSPPHDGSRPIRVLIVDDSALMRQAVRRILSADPEIEVVDVARDGLEALAKVERLQPDVMTMDVEMPHLDGLSALRLLMERYPRPVVMLSSVTAAGAEATVKALALGAVDFMQKPGGHTPGGFAALGDDLLAKVKRAARARVRRLLATRPARTTRPGQVTPVAPRSLLLTMPGRAPDRLLVIGSSTGGPRALNEVVSALPADLPCAVLIVQHLPAGFTRSLAERLDHGSALPVAEAKDGDFLSVGRVLVAPGDFHLRVVSRRVQLDMSPRRHGVRPSVDTTLESAAVAFGPGVLASILTGMGDGTEGARAVKAAGGLVLAEDESTCVVYGMPRAVARAGLTDAVVPLDLMAAAIGRHVRVPRPRPTRSVADAR